MLEVSYECLVSAGKTLESVAGSNTAVFVGSFTSDYRTCVCCFEALSLVSNVDQSLLGTKYLVSYLGRLLNLLIFTTEQMSTKEPDFRHKYAATGVDTGIISNRIGNTFNLHGPRYAFAFEHKEYSAVVAKL